MTSASGLDFRLRPELVALGEEARTFGRSWSEPLDIREDSWLRGTSTAFAAAMGARGWLGMCWPTEVGGGGRSALERFVVVEALISEGAPLASCWFADRQIGPTLLQFGTPEQREEFLPDIVAGRSTWCIGMSEPDAGSDVASLRTSAHRDGDGWVINGSKVWTSGAASADWGYVIARTAGLSEFIVDMRSPGIEVRPIRDMTDDSHFCEVRFVDVLVAEKRRVGTLNGAFRQIMRQMEHERGGIDRLVSNRRLYLDVVASMGETVRAPDWADRFARLESSARRWGPRPWRIQLKRRGSDGGQFATSVMPPATRSWVERRRSCATFARNASWDCRGCEPQFGPPIIWTWAIACGDGEFFRSVVAVYG